MARIRTIKPEHFDDEVLASLPYECRLAWHGLKTQADREGRLEDRPVRLKARLFPYDDGLDMDAVLDQLANATDPSTGAPAPFIVRYVSRGTSLIAIVNFVADQNPHPKEKDTVLPGPDDGGEPGDNGVNTASREKTRQSQEPSNREETRQAMKRNGKPRTDRDVSGSMTIHENPSGPNPLDLGSGSRSGSGGGDRGSAAPPPLGHVLTNGQLRHPALDVIGVWNAMAVPNGLVAVPDQPASLSRVFDALRRVPELDAWQAWATRIGQSSYLTGRTEGRNGRRFRADFWWALERYDEITSGRYDDDPCQASDAHVNGAAAAVPDAASSKAWLERMRGGGGGRG